MFAYGNFDIILGPFYHVLVVVERRSQVAVPKRVVYTRLEVIWSAASILDPFPTRHKLLTALRAPCGVTGVLY